MQNVASGHTVMIVDDEFDSVMPLMRFLEKEGITARYEPDALHALAAIETITPSLIILDVMLGQDHGFDLFTRFRSIKKTSEVPILFLSGLDEIETQIAGLNLGAGDYIVKPYNLREIVARVKLQLRLYDNEQLLRRRNIELSKAYDELRLAQAAVIHAEKLAAIGRLAAGIAHEMSTPLGFIISNLKMLGTYMEDVREMLAAYQALTEACQGGLPAADVPARATATLEYRRKLGLDATLQELQELYRDCLDGAEVIAKVANDLREFSREEYEELVESDVHQLLEKALTLARNELGSRIRLVREFGATPPMACIPGRLIQLFLIILVNAAHAIAQEGVIRLRTEVQDGTLAISITDTGCGIEEKVLPHIFDPFYTTKPAQIGTGLGLSIAQKIVDFHGGSISIASELGKGTEVTLLFPLARHKERTAENMQAAHG